MISEPDYNDVRRMSLENLRGRIPTAKYPLRLPGHGQGVTVHQCPAHHLYVAPQLQRAWLPDNCSAEDPVYFSTDPDAFK